MAFELKEYPHRRFNPLTRQWVLVSPHRNQRPWLGQVEKSRGRRRAAYDPHATCVREIRALQALVTQTTKRHLCLT